jgi:hypothetical protein
MLRSSSRLNGALEEVKEDFQSSLISYFPEPLNLQTETFITALVTGLIIAGAEVSRSFPHPPFPVETDPSTKIKLPSLLPREFNLVPLLLVRFSLLAIVLRNFAIISWRLS